MHNIEPFYNWQSKYNSSEDEFSPFYRKEYNLFECTNAVYNYYIHPEWDEFGSYTLYLKILYADYKSGFAVIEFIGEWNDCLYNDIMYLKRNILEELIKHGIKRFILIGENVMNFHYSDDCYYQEWYEDIEEGWIAAIGFMPHVIDEFKKCMLHHYILFDEEINELNWRKFEPLVLMRFIESKIQKRLE